jgi:PPOX class probable F420-dependent enzyme
MPSAIAHLPRVAGSHASHRNVLVVIDAPCTSPDLCASVRSNAGTRKIDALVVAPSDSSNETQWYVDEDAARAAATRRLRSCVACLTRSGIRADGLLGDPDPVQAIADALHHFPADEILIVTAYRRPSTWLREDAIDRARRTFAQPIEHIVMPAGPPEGGISRPDTPAAIVCGDERLEGRPSRARRRRAKLHLLTYAVGNALFWALWGAISVSADHWYWWPVVPMSGWTLVLSVHLFLVFREPERPYRHTRPTGRKAAPGRGVAGTEPRGSTRTGRETDMEGFEGKYLSLTSFRRDGTGVATPVWFVRDDGRLLVETDGDSYKVKRIRRDAHVRVALCDARGRLRGEPVDADAEILPEGERARVERLLTRKYRVDRYTVYPIYRLVMRLRGRSRANEPPVALSITPR